ncbi:MAG: ABC transporter ATP-binding protein [Acetobacter sp.]|nr:ABC transporter ATP-binding protein [Bacteroides sp.]MCM1340314.1 ABC transporter ATP-binding protein [Acetobacter sp.]MCM1433039.1 ABC transporter ATP-binding protein [Clostridiales bacterium]
MLEIKNVTKKFGDMTAIENISFKVEESSIYGLVGYNGAGKTTLLKTCAGIYKSEGGQVLYNGENVYDNGVVRSDMFFIPDDFMFARRASLKKMAKFYKGYYPNWSDRVFMNMTNAMGLDSKKSLTSFSKGMQKQAEIIFAMATRPKVLLLDEVFDGIDPQKRNLCKKLFIEYMAETNCSMILSSHNLQEISNLCDHVALINGTHLSMDVSVDDISSAYKKYRLIFADNIPQNAFTDIPQKNISLSEKMATIIVPTDYDEEKLKALNPVHMDSVGLSLEEVFLNEMEDNSYDITKIFS